MIGKDFSAEFVKVKVEKTTPTGSKRKIILIETTLQVEESPEFLDDIMPTKTARAGLRKLLTSSLPIDGDVALLIVRPKGLHITFNEDTVVPCELLDILVHPELVDGKLKARLKISAVDIPEDKTGKVLHRLGSWITVGITKSDGPLFGPGVKGVDAGAAK